MLLQYIIDFLLGNIPVDALALLNATISTGDHSLFWTVLLLTMPVVQSQPVTDMVIML